MHAVDVGERSQPSPGRSVHGNPRACTENPPPRTGGRGRRGRHVKRQDGTAEGSDDDQLDADEESDTDLPSSRRQIRYLRKQLAELKRDNRKLRSEKEDAESLYQQLVSETRHERFDERRLNLLKSQNIQLERQLALVNNALGSRREVILEVSILKACPPRRSPVPSLHGAPGADWQCRAISKRLDLAMTQTPIAYVRAGSTNIGHYRAEIGSAATGIGGGLSHPPSSSDSSHSLELAQCVICRYVRADMCEQVCVGSVHTGARARLVRAQCLRSPTVFFMP